jgi:hypothetical protein
MGYAKWAAALRPVFATSDFPKTIEIRSPPRRASKASSTGETHGLGLYGRPRMRTKRAPRAGRRRIPMRPPGRSSRSPPASTRESDAGRRFAVIGGRLVVTTPPVPKDPAALDRKRVPQELHPEARVSRDPNADSGIYVRGPQLQCRDYRIAGPYKEAEALHARRSGNEIEVTVKDGVARATCNGELLEAELKIPASGPIGLEGDRGQRSIGTSGSRPCPRPRGRAAAQGLAWC